MSESRKRKLSSDPVPQPRKQQRLDEPSSDSETSPPPSGAQVPPAHVSPARTAPSVDPSPDVLVFGHPTLPVGHAPQPPHQTPTPPPPEPPRVPQAEPLSLGSDIPHRPSTNNPSNVIHSYHPPERKIPRRDIPPVPPVLQSKKSAFPPPPLPPCAAPRPVDTPDPLDPLTRLKRLPIAVQVAGIILGLCLVRLLSDTGQWLLHDVAEAPSFHPNGGPVAPTTRILMHTPTPNTAICYTDDGTAPACATFGAGCKVGQPYTDSQPPLKPRHSPYTIAAVACQPGGWGDSGVTVSQKFAFCMEPSCVVAAPAFLPDGGPVTDGAPIKLVAPTPGSIICIDPYDSSMGPRCTLDGDTCLCGFRYDPHRPPIKTPAENGRRWAAQACVPATQAVYRPSEISSMRIPLSSPPSLLRALALLPQPVLKFLVTLLTILLVLGSASLLSRLRDWLQPCTCPFCTTPGYAQVPADPTISGPKYPRAGLFATVFRVQAAGETRIPTHWRRGRVFDPAPANYALKRLPIADAADALREISILAAVQHPTVLGLYEEFLHSECLVADGLLRRHYVCVVLELCDRGTLWDLLHGIPRLPAAAATLVLQHALTGLGLIHEAHEFGVAHGDIKSDNLFIGGEGYVKVGDVGSAHVAPLKGSARWRTGTQGYMAPEVYRGDGYGLPADVWSLGVVVLDMLWGMADPAFPNPTPALPNPTLSTLLGAPVGTNLTVALMGHLGGVDTGVELLASQDPLIGDPRLRRLIRWMLRETPAERFTCQALLEALPNRPVSPLLFLLDPTLLHLGNDSLGSRRLSPSVY